LAGDPDEAQPYARAVWRDIRSHPQKHSVQNTVARHYDWEYVRRAWRAPESLR
jgi:hypothetical protein